MKTVIHTIDTWGPGGAETVFVEIASGVDANRFPSVAAVTHPGWVSDTLRHRGTQSVITRTGLLDWAFFWGILTLARRQRAALIHSHLAVSSLFGALAARLLGISAIATFHGAADVAARDRWAKLKLRTIAANATRLVFVSESLRRHFLQTFNIAETRTAVVPNGIDTDRFCPAPHRGLREELGFSDDVLIVGAVGNVRAPKGYDDLMRVAGILRASRPEIRFVIAGNADERLLESLLAQRRHLGLENHVFFLGFRADVAAVLNGVDLYLSTSTSEGFSLTTVQAMACGVPAIATRSGGPEEIVTDGTDGLLVPVGDAGAIARAVADLATDAPRRSRLAEEGRKTVIRRFTLRQMIGAYEALYEEVLAERSSS